MYTKIKYRNQKPGVKTKATVSFYFKRKHTLAIYPSARQKAALISITDIFHCFRLAILHA